MPIQVATYTTCATEGGTCNFSGIREVRYGANGSYAYKIATSSIGCNNTVFGDPAHSYVKSCQYSSIVLTTATPAPMPSLSGSSFNLGRVTLGSTSPAQVLTITNIGKTAMSFPVPFAFSPTTFNGYGDCSETIPLTPGQKCLLNITFTPSMIGIQPGTVTIRTDAISAPVFVLPLTGEGI
jgi:hypothetical protein